LHPHQPASVKLKKMKIVSTINRYILKEFLVPFAVNVLFFTFIFLMAELIEITNWVVNYNINLMTILVMIFYQMPFLLIFVIPISVMITVLLTFLRLSNENEILAINRRHQHLRFAYTGSCVLLYRFCIDNGYVRVWPAQGPIRSERIDPANCVIEHHDRAERESLQ
jgi:hypothetical protein